MLFYSKKHGTEYKIYATCPFCKNEVWIYFIYDMDNVKFARAKCDGCKGKIDWKDISFEKFSVLMVERVNKLPSIMIIRS